MTVALLAEALVRWQHAAGPFWPYVCAAPFLGLGESESLVQTMRLNTRGQRVARERTGRNDALIDLVLSAVTDSGSGPVDAGDSNIGAAMHQPAGFPSEHSRPGGLPVVLADLRAEPLLAVAPWLSAQGWYVVPVIQRWIASPAVLPCRAVLTQLVAGAWQVRRPSQPRGVLLIADGERFGPAGYPLLARGRAFDNRYEYQICRFPSMAFLVAQGAECVTWIADHRPAVVGAEPSQQVTPQMTPVASDLLPYRESLIQTGIRVDVRIVSRQPRGEVTWSPAP